MEKAKIVGRWIVFAPAAIAAAFVAQLAARVLYNGSLIYAGVDPHGLLGRGFSEAAGGIAMGAAFVYVAARVAPRRQREVALIMAAIGLVLTGIAMYPAILVRSYWAMWNDGWCAFGIATLAYSTVIGQLFVPPAAGVKSASPARVE